MSIASTKNIDINDIQLEKVKTNVTGKDVRSLIIIFPTGTPSINGALKNALDISDADVMQNITISSMFWWIPYLYGETSYRITGDAYRIIRKKTASEGDKK
ncbi:MAG: hypothetical protein A2219_03215 [Elusimicrobia bacterium RIFOXYA2_FULL_50_26]|nr:MAG: hypothetical protein A2219_03215 [Elusimicrobia bacterium RIFOXYA2_FULL_50_26]OGS23816.1 MAG: hypothetical protein A2314_09210 [Elusimicrobia bacterium RIFOXYB2_FULL_50_12]